MLIGPQKKHLMPRISRAASAPDVFAFGTMLILTAYCWTNVVVWGVSRADFPALVVKASGLAAGKGVIVAEDQDQACQAVMDIMKVWDYETSLILGSFIRKECKEKTTSHNVQLKI